MEKEEYRGKTLTMRVYVYCEGQTEESFIKRVLSPYLQQFQITTIPIICKTGSSDHKKQKGGVSSYSKIKKELIQLCGEHKNEIVTTMFDYYGFPKETLGSKIKGADLYNHVKSIELAIKDDIQHENCIINLVVHEYEALLFSNPDSFSSLYPHAVSELSKIRNNYMNPEFINDSQATAPSKRISSIISDYSKVRAGVIIAESIGIEKILSECPHFKEWVDTIIRRTSESEIHLDSTL